MQDTTMTDQSWSSTVKDGMKNGQPIGALNGMGTVDHNEEVVPTTPCAKTLEELHSEFKAYNLLRRKDEKVSNCESGTAAYVINTKWLKRYHNFICFD